MIQCQAKIQDGLGNHYKCNEEASVQITTKTFASHLQKTITKVRSLCPIHAGRLKSRFNYKIKHCGKQCEIIQTKL